jgi:hypothetical protein
MVFNIAIGSPAVLTPRTLAGGAISVYGTNTDARVARRSPAFFVSAKMPTMVTSAVLPCAIKTSLPGDFARKSMLTRLPMGSTPSGHSFAAVSLIKA